MAAASARLAGELSLRILAELKIVVVQADAKLRILDHSGGLADCLEPEWKDPAGRLLTDAFPELIGLEESLAEVAGGKTQGFGLPLINRVSPGDAERRYLSLTVFAHPEAQGRLVLLVQDATAQGRLDQWVAQQLNDTRLLRAQLEAANQKLAQLSEEKSAFVQMAAHDLRAPLTVIRGYVDLVMAETAVASDSEAVEHLKIVISRTQQMANLIDNLLDVERIESGKVVLHRELLNLAGIVEQVTRGFQALAEQEGVTLRWQSPTGLPLFLADSDRLVQALSNLLSNALKFTPRGGTVKVIVLERDSDVAVEVSDTGPGISEEDLPRLFQRFFRTDAARRQRIPGTGLGLSIVRAIVEQHGGQVYVRSQVGLGSTFGFTLPWKEE
jgi:signal transduction histidine kinase